VLDGRSTSDEVWSDRSYGLGGPRERVAEGRVVPRKLRIPGTQTKAKAREGDVGRGDMSSTRDVKNQRCQSRTRK
jgi:hypothetical protein